MTAEEQERFERNPAHLAAVRLAGGTTAARCPTSTSAASRTRPLLEQLSSQHLILRRQRPHTGRIRVPDGCEQQGIRPFPFRGRSRTLRTHERHASDLHLARPPVPARRPRDHHLRPRLPSALSPLDPLVCPEGLTLDNRTGHPPSGEAASSPYRVVCESSSRLVDVTGKVLAVTGVFFLLAVGFYVLRDRITPAEFQGAEPHQQPLGRGLRG